MFVLLIYITVSARTLTRPLTRTHALAHIHAQMNLSETNRREKVFFLNLLNFYGKWKFSLSSRIEPGMWNGFVLVIRVLRSLSQISGG